MKRFPFLDWMRGLAVLIMIQCHTINSFTRMDLRESGPYVLSQFVGGMAAPLFLLMAGMTTAFQMESLERREPSPWRRWAISLRRAAYILTIAFTFRFTNWVFSMPHASAAELTKVDILNCMGVGMAALAVAAVFKGNARIRFAVLAGAGDRRGISADGQSGLARRAEALAGIPGTGSGARQVSVLSECRLYRFRTGHRRDGEAHGGGAPRPADAVVDADRLQHDLHRLNISRICLTRCTGMPISGPTVRRWLRSAWGSA